MFSLQREDTRARLEVWKTSCDLESAAKFGLTTVVFLWHSAAVE
jgi:hypothetical protein